MSDILISPFSNSFMRDWPLEHFAALAGLLVERIPPEIRIRIIGVPNQRLRANEIVRDQPVDRVINECGRLAWGEVVSLLRAARCIVSNNSGLGHLGGQMGIPTVCVFGGSHQRAEWRPLGRSVVLVSRAIGCSPCHLDHGGVSPYRKACLHQIEPEVVANAVVLAMARAGKTPVEGE